MGVGDGLGEGIGDGIGEGDGLRAGVGLALALPGPLHPMINRAATRQSHIRIAGKSMACALALQKMRGVAP